MPSEKEIKAASAELRVWMPKALVTTQAVTAILSAAEKEREGHRADCYWLRSTPAVDGDEAACCSCGAVERAEREGETHNGVCLRCGSGVLASGEHIRTDLPPCSREGDIIEKLREWLAAHSAFSNADGLTVLVEVEPLLAFLNDLQEQSTPKEER